MNQRWWLKSSSKPVAWLPGGPGGGLILEQAPYKFTHDTEGDEWVLMWISGNDHADD